MVVVVIMAVMSACDGCCGEVDDSGFSRGKCNTHSITPARTNMMHMLSPRGRHCYKELDKDLASQLGKWLGRQAAEQLDARDWQQQCVGLDAMLKSVGTPPGEKEKGKQPVSLQAMMARARRQHENSQNKVRALTNDIFPRPAGLAASHLILG